MDNEGVDSDVMDEDYIYAIMDEIETIDNDGVIFETLDPEIDHEYDFESTDFS